jgi:hypothetical protein
MGWRSAHFQNHDSVKSTFSNFIADFSKVRELFFGSPSSFYSKVMPDGTPDNYCLLAQPIAGNAHPMHRSWDHT